MMDWFEIGSLDDIPARGARTVDTARGEVAVFRTAEDEVFALINRCPHRGGPLSEGIVAGRKVACPLHNWVIDLNTGAAEAPDEGCTETVPVKLEGGRLWLGITRARKVAHG
jgi:nitrite reductase (NADH) small subunit